MTRLFNTLSRKTEKFEPIEENIVGCYVCGLTVYDYAHIGNARPLIVFDVLRRYLMKLKGYRVCYVTNITDVDDKIIDKAASEGIEPQEVARKYTEAYFEDLEKLGVLPADFQPKATEQIPQMVEFVSDLIDRGYAYQLDGDVYFRVRKFADYGKLSGKSIDELESGARVDVDERKEDPLDFALWKKAKPGEPAWESPWGEGRPGWHIECSVMASSILGETIDIHCGGADLIFPHHENEIAQSEARTGRPFVRYWLHNELLQFEGEKMSKSLGNFEYARDVVERYGTEAVRYFYLSKHYRTPANFTYQAMEDSKRAVERVYHLLEEIDYELERRDGHDLELKDERLTGAGRRYLELLDETRQAYVQHMDDDLNTSGALGEIFELVRHANQFRKEVEPSDLPLLKATAELIRELGEPLGLFQASPWREGQGELQQELIEVLVDVRKQLRAQKEFRLADEIRERLRNLGIELKDKGDETHWSYA